MEPLRWRLPGARPAVVALVVAEVDRLDVRVA
jgi:hypothetical protein